MAYSITGTVASITASTDTTKLNVSIQISQPSVGAIVPSGSGAIVRAGQSSIVTITLPIEATDLSQFIPGSTVTCPINVTAPAAAPKTTT